MRMFTKAAPAVIGAVMLSVLSACGGSASHTAAPTATPATAYAAGVTSDTEYRSDFLDLSFTLPGGWTFGTDDEMTEFFGVGSDMVESELNIGGGPEGSTHYEFFAYDTSGTPSCAIMTAEDLSAHEGGKLVTVREFVDTLAGQYSEIGSRDYEIGDSYQKTVAGREFIILPLSVPDSELFQRNYVFRTGNYMVTITFTAQSDSELDELEGDLANI